MSVISELIAGGTAGLFTSIGTFAKDIRAALTGESVIDPNKKAEILLQAQMLEATADKAKMDYDLQMSKAQTAINEIEAQNTNIFVSGWRPFLGWIGGLGMAYVFLLKPLLPWIVSCVIMIFGISVSIPIMPEIPLGDLITLLFGLLGLSGMRSYEKTKGVASK